MSCDDFLSDMRALITAGKREFIRRTSKEGMDYMDMLLELGFTSVEEAWDGVSELTGNDYFSGPDYDHQDKEKKRGQVIWVFKTEINGEIAYIKLKDERETRGCVCLSFHKDKPNQNQDGC